MSGGNSSCPIDLVDDSSDDDVFSINNSNKEEETDMHKRIKSMWKISALKEKQSLSSSPSLPCVNEKRNHKKKLGTDISKITDTDDPKLAQPIRSKSFSENTNYATGDLTSNHDEALKYDTFTNSHHFNKKKTKNDVIRSMSGDEEHERRPESNHHNDYTRISSLPSTVPLQHYRNNNCDGYIFSSSTKSSNINTSKQKNAYISRERIENCAKYSHDKCTIDMCDNNSDNDGEKHEFKINSVQQGKYMSKPLSPQPAKDISSDNDDLSLPTPPPSSAPPSPPPPPISIKLFKGNTSNNNNKNNEKTSREGSKNDDFSDFEDMEEEADSIHARLARRRKKEYNNNVSNLDQRKVKHTNNRRKIDKNTNRKNDYRINSNKDNTSNFEEKEKSNNLSSGVTKARKKKESVQIFELDDTSDFEEEDNNINDISARLARARKKKEASSSEASQNPFNIPFCTSSSSKKSYVISSSSDDDKSNLKQSHSSLPLFKETTFGNANYSDPMNTNNDEDFIDEKINMLFESVAYADSFNPPSPPQKETITIDDDDDGDDILGFHRRFKNQSRKMQQQPLTQKMSDQNDINKRLARRRKSTFTTTKTFDPFMNPPPSPTPNNNNENKRTKPPQFRPSKRLKTKITSIPVAQQSPTAPSTSTINNSNSKENTQCKDKSDNKTYTHNASTKQASSRKPCSSSSLPTNVNETKAYIEKKQQEMRQKLRTRQKEKLEREKQDAQRRRKEEQAKMFSGAHERKKQKEEQEKMFREAAERVRKLKEQQAKAKKETEFSYPVQDLKKLPVDHWKSRNYYARLGKSYIVDMRFLGRYTH